MDAACNFINMMSRWSCYVLNCQEFNIDFYKSEHPLHKIIEDNMMKGKFFSYKKFSQFLLDKSKRDDIKLALNELEEYGMNLKYCWETNGQDDEDLTRKEKAISCLILKEEIRTFNDLFEAFESFKEL